MATSVMGGPLGLLPQEAWPGGSGLSLSVVDTELTLRYWYENFLSFFFGI